MREGRREAERDTVPQEVWETDIVRLGVTLAHRVGEEQKEADNVVLGVRVGVEEEEVEVQRVGETLWEGLLVWEGQAVELAVKQPLEEPEGVWEMDMVTLRVRLCVPLVDGQDEGERDAELVGDTVHDVKFDVGEDDGVRVPEEH